MSNTRHHATPPRSAAAFGCAWIVASLVASVGYAGQWSGFTEPIRTLNVATEATGTVAEVLVREGQRVEAGQPLARLNCDVELALLAIARENMNAGGRLAAAEAEQALRRERLNKLQVLRREGHARQEEVDRAAGELAIAAANVRAAREEQVSRRLEYRKIEIQIARRTIRAPVAGTVTVLHKRLGEFVAPNSPEVVTLIQVDQLLVNFTVNGGETKQLAVDQQLHVEFSTSGLKTTGIVEFISPVTDAESGSVLVKLRVANPDGRFRSGDRCTVRVREEPSG